MSETVIRRLSTRHRYIVAQSINQASFLTIIDGDIDLYTWLNGDGSQLLDNIGRCVKVNETLVDAHLKAIPSVGTLSGRSLSGGDAQALGWHTDGSLDVELAVEGDLFEVGADLFQVSDIATGESDADAVDLGAGAGGGIFLALLRWIGCHFCW